MSETKITVSIASLSIALDEAQKRIEELEEQARHCAAYVEAMLERGVAEDDATRARVEELEQQSREIVICAAIRLPNGKVFRGHRHGDCLKTAHAFVTWNGGVDPGEHNWDVLDSPGCDQGFITSRNRYVGREEGLRLQIVAGIPSACPSGYRARELFSEDLY